MMKVRMIEEGKRIISNVFYSYLVVNVLDADLPHPHVPAL
jgi:hypothetical protein